MHRGEGIDWPAGQHAARDLEAEYLGRLAAQKPDLSGTPVDFQPKQPNHRRICEFIELIRDRVRISQARLVPHPSRLHRWSSTRYSRSHPGPGSGSFGCLPESSKW